MWINGRKIGPGEPCYIVAEIGASHNQDYHRMEALICAAKDAGADAVKFQTYTADSLTIDCNDERFVIKDGPWKGRKLYDLYRKAAMPLDWHGPLKEFCEKIGISWFSSPFSVSLIRYLDAIECPAFKIASFEAADPEILAAAIRTNRPLIVSLGCINIKDAGYIVNLVGEENICLCHCTSEYPCPVESVNLNTIPLIKKMHKCIVGFSDHTIGRTFDIGAVAFGANLIEKHIKIDDDGEDSAFAMMPHEFAGMVSSIRELEAGMKINHRRKPSLRRSLFIVTDMKEGDVITRKNIRSIRPGDGIQPKFLHDVLGKQVNRDLKRGTPFAWHFIGDSNGRSS